MLTIATIVQALQRRLTPPAHLLCGLLLFGLAAPMCAAAGPVISATISPATLPVTGGVITFSATVNDPGGQAIKNVYTQWTAGGNYNGAVTLANGGSGSLYTGTLNINGSNTSSAPYTFNATVTATNDLNLSNTATMTGRTVQSNTPGPTPQAGLTHLLLNRADGAMAVWTLDATGAVTSSPLYGPIPGWNAHGLAVGPDGLSRVLWSRSDGASAVWTLNADGSVASTPLYGPIPGWSFSEVAVGP